MKLDGGYDYYSSASTDNIDNIQSSDSASDIRTHGNIGVSYKLNKQNEVSYRVGGSVEYDYYSFQTGMAFSHVSKDQNRAINIGAQAFIDQWALIYPVELRESAQAPTSARQSYNVSASLSQIVNKKLQMSLMAEAVVMNGLLSNSFSSCVFSGTKCRKN